MDTSEIVSIIVVRRWIDEVSGDAVDYREAERDLGANQVRQMHDEALALLIRNLIDRTEVEPE